MNPRTANSVVLVFPDWNLNDRNLFGWQLARCLKERAFEVEILVGPECDSSSDARMPDPPDIAITFLEPAYGTDLIGRALAYGAALRSRNSIVLVSIGEFALSTMYGVMRSDVRCLHVLHNASMRHIQQVVKIVRYLDALVVNSEYVAKLLRPYRYIPPRLHLLRPSSWVQENAAAARSGSSPLRVAYAGPMNDWQKGTLLLAPVVEASLSLGSDILLQICGKCSTAYQRRLHAESLRKLTDMGRLEWTETTDPEVMERSFLDTDVFLLPSRHEGFPALLPAAMAAGCVPVVTEVLSGTPELVKHGETGLVAPIGDVAGFASKIHQLYTDRSLLARLSNNARQHVWRAGCSRDFVDRQITDMLQAVEEDRMSGTVYRKSCGLIAIPLENGKLCRDGRPRSEAESRLAQAVHGRMDEPALLAAMLPPENRVLSDKEVRSRLRSLKIADALKRLGVARSLVRRR